MSSYYVYLKTFLQKYKHPLSNIMEEKSGILSLPPRNKGEHLKRFKTTKITANHYHVVLKENIHSIFIYSVKFDPIIPKDNTNRRMELLNKIKPQINEQIPNPVLSGYNIYSTKQPKENQHEYEIDQHKIKVKLVKTYKFKPDRRLLLTFLNNGLRNIMALLNYVEIGRSGKYFNSKQKTEIDSLVMYNGFKANFVYLQSGYFLRVDPARKIIRSENVLQAINILYKQNHEKDKEEKRQIVRSQLINKIVMSSYGKNQYYRIKDVLFIEIASVEQLDLVQYYDKKYGIKIHNLKQPLLEAESRDPTKTIYLIPELMQMTGIPENFDERRRKTISERTIRDPSQKLNQIGSLIDSIKQQQKIKEFEDLGISLNFHLEKIDARIVPTPKLALGSNQSIDKGKQSFFNLFDKPIFQCKHNIYVCIISQKYTDIKELASTFESTAPKLGVNLKIEHRKMNQMDVARIKQEIKKAREGEINICCIIIPHNLKNSYKDIKRDSILDEEIVTQVVVEQTLRKNGLRSIATKLLLQMLAKRGNILWVPQISKEVQFSAMLVGFEQTKLGSKILLAICATINSTYTMVFTAVKTYSGEENKYKTMKDLLLAATAAFVSRNQSPPEQIVCFHNACPRDQIKGYQQFFIAPFKEQANSVYPDKQISISLIMINVKTNQRFFSERDGKPANPQAGTLINQRLVSQNYDFYLISQKPTRGTAVPNHYQVVYSDSKIEEGIIQEIIFSQCFNYVNWTGSIKVPAILQYAKKAANFSVDVLCQNQVPQSLNKRLFFI